MEDWAEELEAERHWEAEKRERDRAKEIEAAAKQAYDSLVGAHAADDSVQGRARLRLGKALGILTP